MLANLLLAWFAQHARALPWRQSRDPYQILVSEVMLQQTQVDRVLPKYAAFLATFPNLHALANAPTAEVIRAWAGLGYNRRAVNLQRAAQQVMAQYDGQFPRNVAELRSLPGIGPYTAGAIACFAFEQDVVFMDTNIRRVLQRALVGPDLQVAPPERQLLEQSATLLPSGQGWAWNQALMELGALICTARNPSCAQCPIQRVCRAYSTATPPALPRPLRRVAEGQREAYHGSRRWLRGRIIDALREQPQLSLSQLGPRLKPDYSAADEAWLRDLVVGLERDGLVAMQEDRVGLP
ncbi:HhH-GPD family protein [Oscillochloris trichoides DG-6]|uniref:Adenine DNA glycosylase n=1 Tax=Oscillochloris trichoides DG-6 TaxID=765420 RepID=E1II20_9CHLR|nr:A/G-specific adenine glycosylase [Oscillochloris trichoides]EFO79138.1 HhH-GPD family protein [Oscillochloris trichoides DG-6]